MRDLDKVWNSDKIQELKMQGMQFDAKNTLLIDTDELKVAQYHDNSLIMSPYDREDVINSKTYANENMQINILKMIATDVFLILN